jgi:hypothetical protein
MARPLNKEFKEFKNSSRFKAPGSESQMSFGVQAMK